MQVCEHCIYYKNILEGIKLPDCTLYFHGGLAYCAASVNGGLSENDLKSINPVHDVLNDIVVIENRCDKFYNGHW